jgi:hypothetical protein
VADYRPDACEGRGRDQNVMKNAAIVEALAGLPSEHARALEPILRIVSHDLNGAMSPLTLEAFTLRDLAVRLHGTTGNRLPVDMDVAEVLEALSEASANLQLTANRVSDYLAEVRRLVEHAGA